MSHFPTSLPTTAFYPKLGCIQFSLQKLQMLTPVHNDANDTDNGNKAEDADNYNRVIGIAQLKAFSCGKNQFYKIHMPQMLKELRQLLGLTGHY